MIKTNIPVDLCPVVTNSYEITHVRECKWGSPGGLVGN